MSTVIVPKFISNWQKYNTFLQKQDVLLADIFKHYQGKRPKHEYQLVLSSLLHRHAMNFRVIYLGWGEFLKNSHFKFSIFSLLRPILADYLLMLYLIEEFKFKEPTWQGASEEDWEVDEQDFIKRYEAVSSAFFERLNHNLKKKVKNKELSEDEMNEILSHHHKEFPEYFENGEVLKRSLSPAQMADRIVKGKLFINELYEYYFRLSQFEHFTIITEGLMHDVTHNWEMIHIKEVTDYLLDYMSINLTMLRVPQEFKNRMIDLINEFRSMEWQYDVDPAIKSSVK